MALTLVIGNKNYSSWSLRPWLAMSMAGIAFDELRIPLDQPDTKANILRHSPTGKVPCLLDAGAEGTLTVWDSLAICEYVNETHASGRMWPAERRARARARSTAAEMHSGFAALRGQWSMRAADSGLEVPLDAAARADVARIDAIWADCRARGAGGGPWLFGSRYGIADAMYAPVALRFSTYGAALSPGAQAYLEHALADPHLLDWIRGARHELAAQGRPAVHP